MTDQISAGQILGRTWTLLRRGAARAGAVLVVLAGLGIAIDSGAVSQSNASAVNLVVSGVSVASGYWITKALLQDIADHHLPARFPAFFGLGLLSSLAILVGMVALVVPGVILFVRWSVSDPILLSSDEGVTEAMQHSWRVTGPHFWPILVAVLAIYGPSFGLALSAYALDGVSPGNIAAVILANLALNAGVIAGWHAAVAIYTLIEAPDRLAETFA